MSAIFISHSSADNPAAVEMKAWLEAQGHTSLFLDFDPEAGIKGGTGWEQTLYQILRQCQAVIALLTPNWLVSKWCFAELVQARERGKAIFPVKVRPCETGGVFSDIQHIDLTARRRKVMSGSESVSLNGGSIRWMFSTGTPSDPLIRACWPFRSRTRRSFSDVARTPSRRSKSWTQFGAKGARWRVSCCCSAPPAAASPRWSGRASFPGSGRNPPSGCQCRPSGPRSNRSTSWPWRSPRVSKPTAGRATGARFEPICTRQPHKVPWMASPAGSCPGSGDGCPTAGNHGPLTSTKPRSCLAIRLGGSHAVFSDCCGPARDRGRRLMVVATLRSDFLGDFQNHPVLQDSDYPHHFRYRAVPVDPMPLRGFRRSSAARPAGWPATRRWPGRGHGE